MVKPTHRILVPRFWAISINILNSHYNYILHSPFDLLALSLSQKVSLYHFMRRLKLTRIQFLGWCSRNLCHLSLPQEYAQLACSMNILWMSRPAHTAARSVTLAQRRCFVLNNLLNNLLKLSLYRLWSSWGSAKTIDLLFNFLTLGFCKQLVFLHKSLPLHLWRQHQRATVLHLPPNFYFWISINSTWSEEDVPSTYPHDLFTLVTYIMVQWAITPSMSPTEIPIHNRLRDDHVSHY